MSSQPIKKSGPFQKPRSKTVKRRKKNYKIDSILKFINNGSADKK